MNRGSTVDSQGLRVEIDRDAEWDPRRLPSPVVVYEGSSDPDF